MSEPKEPEKFASDFHPIYSASNISTFTCIPRTEYSKTRIEFLLRFEPFKQYRHHNAKVKKSNPVLMRPEEKTQILNDLNKNVENSCFHFDDDTMIENIMQKNMDSLAANLEGPVLKPEKSESETDSYNTADSDEEYFKLKTDPVRMEKIKRAQVKRYVATNRGKLLEGKILEKINAIEESNFVKNKDVKHLDCGNFTISGSIDGIDNEKKQIIEIKTRKNYDSTKDTITKGERIQALVYMKIYDCEKCLFVESGGKDGEMKTNVIEWNEKEFNKVTENLEKFTESVRNLTKSEFEEILEKVFI